MNVPRCSTPGRRRGTERMILIRHPVNRGKGSAVLTGARYAAQAGYSQVLQIDADGQHRVADIARFLEQAAAQSKGVDRRLS